MEEAQLSSSSTVDSSLHRIHTDMHQLAGSMLDIALRLEDRLDVLAERPSGDAVQRAPQAKKEMRGNGLDLDGLKRSKSRQDARQDAAPAHAPRWELASDERRSATPDKRNSSTEERQKTATGSLRPAAGSARSLMSAICGDNFEASAKLPETAEIMDRLPEFNSKFGAIDRKLEQIAIAMGVRGVSNEGDDEEDRKRLKEKLKQAIEADRRSRVRPIISRGEMWLEYVFGICRPDQRLGKRGSR